MILTEGEVRMENARVNQDCRLSSSPYCARLNQPSCAKCFVSSLDEQQQLAVREDLSHIAENLPEDGVLSIAEGSGCALCRSKQRDGSDAGTPSGFANIDMCHDHPSEPITRGRRKYERGAAMTIPVQLPVCSACRRRLTLINNLPIALGVLVAAAGIAIVSIEHIRVALTARSRLMPIIVFLIFAFLGVVAESGVKKLLRTRAERSMNTRSRRIPALGELIALIRSGNAENASPAPENASPVPENADKRDREAEAEPLKATEAEPEIKTERKDEGTLETEPEDGLEGEKTEE